VRTTRSLPLSLATLAAAVAALAAAAPGSAGNEIDYQDPLTAVQPIARPPTHSCTVTVTQDFAFNSSVGHDTFNGTLAPPAGCPGPWSCSTSPAGSRAGSSTG
jgi:hypothetical protein